MFGRDVKHQSQKKAVDFSAAFYSLSLIYNLSSLFLD